MTTRELFLRNVAQTSDAPLLLEIIKAEGIYLYGASGEKYIDLIAGIGVSSVGHRHPIVVNAIKDQVDSYMHLMVYGEYIQSPQVQLAKAIVETLPQPLDNVYFVNSGAEAIDAAMKLAKRVTGRTQLISCKNAYHGSSQGALSIMGSEFFKQAYRPLLPQCDLIQFNLIDDLNKITERTAAVFVETIQGEAGIRLPENEYFKQLRSRCSQTGTLLVLDEIQAGIGRTGTFWAFEQYGIVPDMLVSAKGLGGGMPIAALISSKYLMNHFSNEPYLGHLTTFGGHPVTCAAGLATLTVIKEEGLVEQVSLKAQRFVDQLKHPLIKEVRNKGLMMAAEFDSYEVLKPIIDQCIKNGVITDWFLFCNNAMRIAPPLTITFNEIDKAVEIILKSIKEVSY